MKTFLLGSAAAALILGTGAALATTAKPQTNAAAVSPKHGSDTGTRADLNGRVAKAFAMLDTNHDGFITKDEMNSIESQRHQKFEQRAKNFDPSKIFDRLDRNHDGKVTLAEADAARSQRTEAKGGQPAQAHAAAFKGLFERADTNKDGVITRAEFDTMGEQIKTRMEHAAVAGEGMAQKMFERADANKDGRVSLAEMQQAALARFDRVDLNHDGKISPQERQQVRKQLKGKPHQS
jgi:Ca2+-binding EF-hand superfamily protein